MEIPKSIWEVLGKHEIRRIREGGMEMDRQKPYLYWLNCIKTIGMKTVSLLIDYAGSAEEVYRMPLEEAKGMLNKRQLDYFVLSRKTWNLYTEYEKLEQKGIRFIPYGCEDYPVRLAAIPGCPAAIYVIGRLPKDSVYTVAIIGTRNCSEYGSYMARQFGRDFAKAGVQVVSGLARGIDGIGQKAVMEAGGETFAVLGCGVDICYPFENRELYEALKEKGGIMSEYPPGTEPKATLFPPRNRIISGLSDSVLVIEAREKSGTLITVDMALEQGRDVFALPGRVTDSLSSGCNKLIKQGACMVVSPQDLLWEVGERKEGENLELLMAGNKEREEEGGVKIFDSEMEETVFDSLDFYPKSLEQIHEECPQIMFSGLMNSLMKLCLKDAAEQIGSGHYVKKQQKR